MTFLYGKTHRGRKIACESCGHQMTVMNNDGQKLRLSTVKEYPAKKCSCCKEDLFNPKDTTHFNKYGQSKNTVDIHNIVDMKTLKTFKVESHKNSESAIKIYEKWLNNHFTNPRLVQTCKICGGDVEMYGYYEDDDDKLDWNGDSFGDMEDHITSHDTDEWLKYKNLNDPDGSLPYFDHEGKQIKSNEYHSRYTFSDRI